MQAKQKHKSFDEKAGNHLPFITSTMVVTIGIGIISRPGVGAFRCVSFRFVSSLFFSLSSVCCRRKRWRWKMPPLTSSYEIDLNFGLSDDYIEFLMNVANFPHNLTTKTMRWYCVKVMSSLVIWMNVEDLCKNNSHRPMQSANDLRNLYSGRTAVSPSICSVSPCFSHFWTTQSSAHTHTHIRFHFPLCFASS